MDFASDFWTPPTILLRLDNIDLPELAIMIDNPGLVKESISALSQIKPRASSTWCTSSGLVDVIFLEVSLMMEPDLSVPEPHLFLAPYTVS